MGELLDSLQASPKGRTGRRSTWGELSAALGPEATADVLAAFLDESIEVTRIKDLVEAKFPDAPVKSTTTWRNWAREHRHANG